MPRPLFIVGLPRSGSTVFYNTLALHPRVAWISQTSKKFPRSLLLTRIYSRVRLDRRPTEGHRIWRRFAPRDDDVLTRADATEVHRRFYRRLVDVHERLTGRDRFLSKYPRNVLRMDWLDAIFPDALFLHLIRDGRAVARSTLEMRDRHGGRDRWWGARPREWRELDRLDPLEAVSRQWKVTIEHARRSAAAFTEGRYIEIRYEDFCERPVETLVKVGEWADLRWPDGAAAEASRSVESRNYKWRDGFDADEIATIERAQSPLLQDLGYL